MDEKRLRDSLRAHVGFMETSDRDPNKANFAGIDTSGLTYGRMQNDTGSNDMARAALGAMLMMEGMTQEEWARLDPVLATKRLTKDDLESRYPGASGKINDALAANSEFVTNMDDNSLAHVVGEVKRVFGAAKGRGGFNPDNPNWTMVGEAGAWANQVPRPQGHRQSHWRNARDHQRRV